MSRLQVTAETDRINCPECGKEVSMTKAGKPRSHKCDPVPVQPVRSAGGAITADMVIAKYVETRDLIEEKKKALDAELADLKVIQENRANWLKTQMDALGAESIKSVHGTCFIDWKDSATVADGEAYKEWVYSDWENRKHFLENRVSKTAVKQELDDGRQLPPGVNYVKFKDVKIRRA